jgi:hypothetical protein
MEKKIPAKVEIVDKSDQLLDERLVKAFESIAERTFLNIQKRDFRATMVHREEKGDIPDSAAALIHIDESARDELDNPIEYDVKGHISPYEAFMFKDVNYAMALANLKDWAFFEAPDVDATGKQRLDENGNLKLVRIPVNLAQIDMLSKKRLNLSVGGAQSWMHIHERRANAGMPTDEDFMSKVYAWSGLRREKVSKEELEAQYGASGKK